MKDTWTKPKGAGSRLGGGHWFDGVGVWWGKNGDKYIYLNKNKNN